MSLLVHGDAHEVLRAMPDGSVDQLITSPPYFRQRDYGMPGQIGRERTVEEYLTCLLAVFDEAKRILRPEGTCFVNLGDKYIGKRRMLIPERFAIEMDQRGLILRNYIVWHKTNPKPESIRSRFANDWEAVFFFVKSESHYFSIQHEEYAESSVKRCISFVKNEEKFDPNRHKHDPANARQAATRITERVAKNLCIPGQTPNGMHIERSLGRGRDVYDVRGRRMRSVWSLPVGRYGGAHFAVWPPELVRRMILAGCRPGGTILDPFVGSGTTIVVAEELGYTGIGIDLNSDYLEMAKQRILEARTKRNRLTCVPSSRGIADADAPAIHSDKKPKKRRKASRPDNGDTDCERYTPREIIALVRQVMTIDLDPASCEEANTVVQAKQFFTKIEDGRQQLWWGNVFLNSPFDDRTKEFLTKLQEEMRAGRVPQAIALFQTKVLQSVTADWFRWLLQGSFCVPYVRPRFWRGENEFESPSTGIILWYGGPNHERFAEVFKPFGDVIRGAFCEGLGQQVFDRPPIPQVRIDWSHEEYVEDGRY